MARSASSGRRPPVVLAVCRPGILQARIDDAPHPGHAAHAAPAPAG